MQWSSGVITEIGVPRWTRGEMFTTSKKAREQIRALAAEGHRDEEIGARRNVDGRRGEVGASPRIAPASRLWQINSPTGVTRSVEPRKSSTSS